MVHQIRGNATTEQKSALEQTGRLYSRGGRSFADSVLQRLTLTEASLTPQEHGPKRVQAHLEAEFTVDEDMCNGLDIMHGGCITTFIDALTSQTICLLSHSLTGKPGSGMGVTQNLNITMHAPAVKSQKVRVICTTLSFGTRTMSARCEMWDIANERLIASGVHIKMEPRVAMTVKL